MKKKVYTRSVSMMLSEKMFDQVKTIADNEEIGISDYIREAIREKLATFNQNNFQKGDLTNENKNITHISKFVDRARHL